MEKNQYNLCLEVLRRLSQAGVLKDIILIGSWCIPFYKDYFGSIEYPTIIKTRDVDFLVPTPSKTKMKADIPTLLKDLGFIVGFKGAEGYIQLEHADLIVEFLVPEKGRGLDRPYQLPQFSLNAQALRFLDLLIQDTIKVKIEGIEVNLPHPANFALHKLIIFQRRTRAEKTLKDKNAAVEILKALINKGEAAIIKYAFNSMLPKWQKKAVKGLEEAKEREVLNILTASKSFRHSPKNSNH
ncbi:MAG: GSU2403 family nucleotidyltransferase fold protein [Candidatus Omnitrophota bacterium]